MGVELVAGHSVLLGDLVTNGLDSATALDLMRTFYHMVKAGLSMLCTVVQAGPELFALFERILVMSKGSVIYSGPPAQAEEYFASRGFLRPAAKTVPQFLEELSATPELFFRPDHAPTFFASQPLVGAGTQQLRQAQPRFSCAPQHSLRIRMPGEGKHDVAAPNESASFASLNMARIDAWKHLNDQYAASVFYADVRESLQVLIGEQAYEGDATHSMPPSATVVMPSTTVSSRIARWRSQYHASLWLQFNECLSRQVRLCYRNRSSWLHIWVQSIFLAFMLGSLFYRDQLDATPEGVQSRVSLYFYLTLLLVFNSFATLPTVLAQRPLYYLQVHQKFFAPAAYLASFMLVQTVVILVDVFILLVVIWGLSDLPGVVLAGAFWFALLVLLTSTLAARALIILVAYLVPNEILAATILIQLFRLTSLLSGEFVSKVSVSAATPAA